MIKGITGVPGAGKTYFAVNLTAEKFFKWDDVLLEWVPKNNKKAVTIFSNISSLKLPHYDLDTFFAENNIDYEKFFTVDYITKLIEKHGQILFLIDEAQKFFPSDYRNKDVLFFFQYHRHLGVDIILTFQSWISVSKKITDLMEFEIRAVRRSFSMVGEFRYHYYFGNERHGGKKLQPDHKIFGLYKSFEQSPNEKPPRPAKKLIYMIVVLVAVFFFGWKLFLGMFEPPKKSHASVTIEPPVKPVKISAAERGGDGLQTRSPAPSPAAIQPQKQEKMRISVTRVQLGGFWYGRKLIAIDFFGNLINVREMPYQYQDDYDNHRVWVMVPDSILAQIKTATPDEYSLNGFYPEKNGLYRRLGEGKKDTSAEKGLIPKAKQKLMGEQET